MMRNLPVPVKEEDIDQMFDFADKDKDGKINYRWEEEERLFTEKLIIHQELEFPVFFIQINSSWD